VKFVLLGQRSIKILDELVANLDVLNIKVLDQLE
jgi:ABC-type transport system involved in cytochrome c biogenesis ATPase subunit